jgi:hypothetical protein
MPALHQLTPSLAESLGVSTPRSSVKLPEADHVVLVLIDGLGWIALSEHQELTPHIRADRSSPWTADLPTTTPTGLAGIGTGMSGGEHGFVGATFFLPETQQILTPLHWPELVSPVMVQPEGTIFEALVRNGVRVSTIGPGAYQHSGLTQAVLRGGNYFAAGSVLQYGDALVAAQAHAAKSFTYVYWPDLDRAGHRFGVASQQWRSALTVVDDLIHTLVGHSVPETALVVTADHGMVDVTQDDRIALEELSSLRNASLTVAGEPRFRHLFVDRDADEIAERLTSEIGHGFDVYTREQIARSGIFGELDLALVDRIGDIVCIGRDRWLLASNVDQRVSGFIGQHGAGSVEEQLIPAIFQRI